jgi:hypothetical protein
MTSLIGRVIALNAKTGPLRPCLKCGCGAGASGPGAARICSPCAAPHADTNHSHSNPKEADEFCAASLDGTHYERSCGSEKRRCAW